MKVALLSSALGVGSVIALNLGANPLMVAGLSAFAGYMGGYWIGWAEGWKSGWDQSQDFSIRNPEMGRVASSEVTG